jgi:hypothetical protein
MRILRKVLIICCLTGLVFFISFESARAALFSGTGTYSESLGYGYWNNHDFDLTVPGYNASQINDLRFFTFSVHVSGDPFATDDTLQLSVELPDGDWQWIDQMKYPDNKVNSHTMSFSETEFVGNPNPWWQLDRLDEALGDDGILSIKLVGGGQKPWDEDYAFVVDEVKLYVSTPESGSIWLLSGGILGLAGLCFKARRRRSRS